MLALSVLILWWNHGSPDPTHLETLKSKSPPTPATNTQGSGAAAAPHMHIQHSPVAGTDVHHHHTSPQTQHQNQPEFGKLEQSPWAITYSPIQSSGKCKPLVDVMLDLERIKATGAKVVRLYSTDCNVLEAMEPTTKKAKKTQRMLVKQRKINEGVKLDAVVGLFPYVDESGQQEEAREANSAKWFPSLDDQLQDLARWGLWSRVSLLSVGSGGVFDGSYTRADLVAMIRHVKRELLVSHGQSNVRVTTAEPVQSYVSTLKFNAQDARSYRQYRRAVDMSAVGGPAQTGEDDDLCAAVDVVGLAVQPFFNAAVAPDAAGALVQRDLKFVEYLCSDLFIGSAHMTADFGAAGGAPKTQRKLNYDTEASDKSGDSYADRDSEAAAQDDDKELIVMEAGWPSEGLENGEAVPGAEEQLVAISSILKARNPRTGKVVPVALYTFEDETWREPGSLSVETHFGVSRLF